MDEFDVAHRIGAERFGLRKRAPLSAVRCADESVPPDGECSWSTGARR
ncbi:MAG TPA: hypothetical protein VLF18_00950 [Tahibacter sp.]|nr:hypothetical protein [Tahibacter sp.]HSX58742.1 hypothetical protein [Tahibacter sp.]